VAVEVAVADSRGNTEGNTKRRREVNNSFKFQVSGWKTIRIMVKQVRNRLCIKRGCKKRRESSPKAKG